MCCLPDYLQEFKEFAQQHTDIVLSVRRLSENKAVREKMGSCLHLTFQATKASVTCDHCLPEECFYFTGAPRLAYNRIPDNLAVHQVMRDSVTVLSRRKQQDIALLETAQINLRGAGKVWFSVAEMNKADVSQQIGKPCFIYGMYGAGTRVAHYVQDGLEYTQVPTYVAKGTLSSVEDEFLVADFTEGTIVMVNSQSFPHLSNLEPLGGYRDISGCSGSGLWIKKPDYQLLGVLRGSRTPIQADKHLVVFAPVWQVTELMKS
jgi:hypothetical protein